MPETQAQKLFRAHLIMSGMDRREIMSALVEHMGPYTLLTGLIEALHADTLSESPEPLSEKILDGLQDLAKEIEFDWKAIVGV